MKAKTRNNWVKAAVSACILVASIGSAAQAAQTYMLSNDNATAFFDVGAGGLGQTSWTLDGVEHLALQWFWYRIGNSGPETRVTDGLNLVSHSDLDLGAGFGHVLTLRYANVPSLFTIDMGFTLVGAGNQTSIDEQITITNTSGAPLDLHFFEGLDFDLDGSGAGDVVRFPSNNTVEQADGLFVSSEVVSTSANPPSAYEGGEASLIDRLSDGDTDNLNNTPALNDAIAPSNATVAFQWDWTIPAGGSEQISKLKRIDQIAVPSPVAAWGAMALLAALGWIQKIRR